MYFKCSRRLCRVSKKGCRAVRVDFKCILSLVQDSAELVKKGCRAVRVDFKCILSLVQDRNLSKDLHFEICDKTF